MKKLSFFLAVAFYAGIGILGLMSHGYTEETSLSKAASDNLILLILASIILGGIFFYFFVKTFPKGYTKQNQFAKFLIPVLFLILSFALNRASLQVINVLGGQRNLKISGHIYSKEIRPGSKRNFYSLILMDSITGVQYKFSVKKSIFYQTGNEGDKISKNFLIGSLGIIYRENP